MIKIKLDVELTEEQVKDIFESYGYKFTKKKTAELKKSIKENPEQIHDEIVNDVIIAVGYALDKLYNE